MKPRILAIVLLTFLAVCLPTFAETRTPTDPPPGKPPEAKKAETLLPEPPPDRDVLLHDALRLLHEQQRLAYQRALVPPSPPPAPQPSPWILPLLATAAAASFLGAAFQPFLYRHQRTALARTSIVLHAIENAIESSIRPGLAHAQKARGELADRIASTHETTLERLSILFHEVGDLKERLASLTQMVEENATAPTGSRDAVRLEHEVLAEHWRHFREKKVLGGAEDGPSHESPWENLLNDLPTVVPAELKPSLEAVLTPYREHRLFIQRLGIIPQVVSGKMPLASEAAELKRARDLSQLLIAAQGPDGSSRLQFRFHDWVTDTFLPFADLYLQSYQKAHLEQRATELQNGVALIRDILSIAALEPIDVTLGETRFDSARHIGRSISSDPQFPDGVITGVVRNGFVERGRQVIRQPEVIVNRVR